MSTVLKGFFLLYFDISQYIMSVYFLFINFFVTFYQKKQHSLILNISSVPLYAYSLLFTFFFSLSDLTYNFIVILFIQPVKEQYNRCYDPQNSGNGRK